MSTIAYITDEVWPAASVKKTINTFDTLAKVGYNESIRILKTKKMKSIKKATHRKRTLVIILAVLVVIAGSYTAFAAVSKTGPFAPAPVANNSDSTNYDPPTDEQKEAGDKTSDEAKTNDPTTEQPTPTKPTDNTAPDTPSGSTVDVTMNMGGNTSVFQLRAQIQSLKSGTCTLTMKMGEKTVKKTAPTQAMSSYSTCQGFNIPRSELPAGTWHVTLSFKGSSNVTGKTTATKTLQ